MVQTEFPRDDGQGTAQFIQNNVSCLRIGTKIKFPRNEVISDTMHVSSHHKKAPQAFGELWVNGQAKATFVRGPKVTIVTSFGFSATSCVSARTAWVLLSKAVSGSLMSAASPKPSMPWYIHGDIHMPRPRFTLIQPYVWAHIKNFVWCHRWILLWYRGLTLPHARGKVSPAVNGIGASVDAERRNDNQKSDYWLWLWRGWRTSDHASVGPAQRADFGDNVRGGQHEFGQRLRERSQGAGAVPKNGHPRVQRSKRTSPGWVIAACWVRLIQDRFAKLAICLTPKEMRTFIHPWGNPVTPEENTKIPWRKSFSLLLRPWRIPGIWVRKSLKIYEVLVRGGFRHHPV